MHIRLIESGNDGKRVAIDAEGDLAAVVRLIVADKLGCYGQHVGAIRFDFDTAVVFNPAGSKEHRLEGRAARELRETLALLYPALLL
jgi:hypothetical protein